MTKAHIHSIFDAYLYLEVDCEECKEFQSFIGYLIDLADYYEKLAVKTGD